MLFGYTMMVIAISISVIAAWYSIAGLTAIFAAAVIPVIIMGGALEAGKIVATVWLHNNWKRITWTFKLYLIPAIVFLMLLTSMGIFGFLSGAHSDQGLVSGDAMSKVAIYDENIKTAKENIEANRKALTQMDMAVDNLMARTDDSRGAERSVQIRKSQRSERSRLNNEITTYQKEIAKLTQERAPFAAEFRKIEAEVGPIKYIAAFIYGDNPDTNLLENAVRWVIILIVIVFDPLALCLILASNRQLEWGREDKRAQFSDTDEPGPMERTVFEPKEREPEEIFDPNTVEVTTEEEEAFKNLEPKQEIAELDTSIGNCPKCDTELMNAHGIGPFCPNKECDILDGYLLHYADDDDEDEQIPEALIKVFQSKQKSIIAVLPQPKVEQAIDTEGVTSEAYKTIDGEYVEFEGKHMHQRVLRDMRPDLFALRADTEAGSTTGFGTAFPEAAVTGDIFVRVDILPNRVYKFNRDRWIEITKAQSDSYLHNSKYLAFLVDKIATGEVDPETLTTTEQTIIEQYIKDSSKNG